MDITVALRRLFADDARFFNFRPVNGAAGPFEVTVDGIRYRVAITADVPELGAFHRIFCHTDTSKIQAAVSIELNDHVAGGQFVPPIAAGYLSLIDQMATALQAGVVLWSPANLLIDAAYFGESVRSYLDGGPFPVLATVAFDSSDSNGTLKTRGLHWFAGQEFDLETQDKSLSVGQLVRRAVRLVHDIATRGPVLLDQQVADLDSDGIIQLTPNDSGTRLVAIIRPKMDQPSKSR